MPAGIQRNHVKPSSKDTIMLNPSRTASRAAGACALALALLSPAYAAPVLDMSTTTTSTGIDLTVSVQNVTDLYSYQFTLNFSPTLLSAVAVGEGAFLASAGATYFYPGDIDNSAGSISFVLASLFGPTAGVDGSGDLATFSFDVKSAGLASFSFSEVMLLDSSLNPIDVDTRDVVAEVPEPASLWLAGIGLFALFGGRAIRSRAA